MTLEDFGIEPWETPEVQSWSQLLLNSYCRWMGHELIDRSGTIREQARALFHAPFVVVSHGTEEDPVLNYGNQRALDLWEATWQQFIRTPSRLTAEPTNQVERTWMLDQATARGVIQDYRGVRISMTGRRFLVEHAIVWNVVDVADDNRGQAATFSTWTFLNKLE